MLNLKIEEAYNMERVSDWIGRGSELNKRVENLINNAKIPPSDKYTCKKCRILSKYSKGEIYPIIIGGGDYFYCYGHKILKSYQVVGKNEVVIRIVDDIIL